MPLGGGEKAASTEDLQEVQEGYDEPPLHVETGDQMKVKQVLDEAVAKAVSATVVPDLGQEHGRHPPSCK